MRTRNGLLAILFLIMLGVASCATLTRPVVEQEEEEVSKEWKPMYERGHIDRD